MLVHRYRHEVAIHENLLILFGGGTSQEAENLDILDAVDLKRSQWTRLKTFPDDIHGKFMDNFSVYMFLSIYS